MTYIATQHGRPIPGTEADTATIAICNAYERRIFDGVGFEFKEDTERERRGE